MNASSPTSQLNAPGLRLLRWVARLAGLASCIAIAALAYNQRMNPAQMGADDLLLFVFFPTAVALGLVLGWWRDLVGGAVAVGGWAAFQLAHSFVVGSVCKDWEVNGLSAAGLLFLLSGILRARARTGAAARRPSPQPSSPAASDTPGPPTPP